MQDGRGAGKRRQMEQLNQRSEYFFTYQQLVGLLLGSESEENQSKVLNQLQIHYQRTTMEGQPRTNTAQSMAIEETRSLQPAIGKHFQKKNPPDSESPHTRSSVERDSSLPLSQNSPVSLPNINTQNNGKADVNLEEEEEDIEAHRKNCSGHAVTSEPPRYIDKCGMFLDDYGNFIVNGPSSTYHRRFSSYKSVQMSSSPSSSARKKHLDQEAIRAQLVVHASFQKQKEIAFYYESKFDFDGLDGELAMHLIELHFNRQHCAYLISYRPAFMDSLATNGPYVNKLLLNSVYFSSCLYSGRRKSISGSPFSKDQIGQRFYERFKELLPLAFEKSTIPSICAFLFMGAAMTSFDRKSEGWSYCGHAYRMLVDMGCHLEVEYLDKTGRYTPMDLEIRRRVFWGAYINDKFQALYFGRPAALHKFDGCAVKEFLDTFEEYETWQPYCDPSFNETTSYQPRHMYAISTFKLMIKLAEIAAAILRKIYTVDSINNSRATHKANVAALKMQLDQWQETLPIHLHFDPETDPTPPPHQITPQ